MCQNVYVQSHPMVIGVVIGLSAVERMSVVHLQQEFAMQTQEICTVLLRM